MPRPTGLCEYCDSPLEQHQYVAGCVVSATCEFCRQPHRITEDGAWVAVERDIERRPP